MSDDNNGKKTPGERALAWAKSVGALAVALGVVLGWFKSDDAQSGVDNLVQQLSERVAKQEKVINTQSEKLEKMARRMIFFQGHQSGVSAGRLSLRVEELEEDLSGCIAKSVKRAKVNKTDIEDLIGSAFSRRGKRSPAPKPQDTEQQKIPRLYSKPFKKAN